MRLEGRKHARTPERFLVQISSVHDPLLEELVSIENVSLRGARVTAERTWEPGLHVELNSRTDKLQGRARVVYCQVIGPKTFAVGLNFLSPTTELRAGNGSAVKEK
jgi:hypothetical protein